MNEKKYKRKARRYKIAGMSTIGLTTVGGFTAYQSFIDWENFRTEINEFVIVQENTMKLNLVVALPILIGTVIFIWAVLRKNREYFKDKISLNVMILIIVLYMIYSIIEVTMASLVGLLAGSFIDEFVFMPLSEKNMLLSKEQHEIDTEYAKEAVRIKARKKAQDDINGSV